MAQTEAYATKEQDKENNNKIHHHQTYKESTKLDSFLRWGSQKPSFLQPEFIWIPKNIITRAMNRIKVQKGKNGPQKYAHHCACMISIRIQIKERKNISHEESIERWQGEISVPTNLLTGTSSSLFSRLCWGSFWKGLEVSETREKNLNKRHPNAFTLLRENYVLKYRKNPGNILIYNM